MALYMIQFAYTAEAWATLAKNPQDRSVPIRNWRRSSVGAWSVSTTALESTTGSCSLKFPTTSLL